MSYIRPYPLPTHYADFDIVAGRPVRSRHEKHPQPGIPLHAQRKDGHQAHVRKDSQAARGRCQGATEGRTDTQVGDFYVGLIAFVAAILLALSDWIGWPIPY